MFDSLSSKLQNAFRNLRGLGKISEENVGDALREVRLALLEADVNFKVARLVWWPRTCTGQRRWTNWRSSGNKFNCRFLCGKGKPTCSRSRAKRWLSRAPIIAIR